MADLFKDAPLTFPCQNCGHQITKKIVELEKNPDITCPECGATIKVNADDLKAARQRVNDRLEEFQRNVGKLNRR